MREFLNDIDSGLIDEKNIKELYRKLKISVPENGHDKPKNVGLLFFSDDPEEWFAGTRIEVVQFSDAAGDILEEKKFIGPIHEQLKDVLSYLQGFASAYTEKQADSFRVRGWISYPIPALREALVNAVYHRSYENEPEPVKVYLYNDKIEIISYPGPVVGIELGHLQLKKTMPPVPARNRRIGEFLKELHLAEGRGTGLPKLYKAMENNGSPEPSFDFDEARTYFRVVLPAHPEYAAISAIRDASHLRALGKEQEAFERIKDTWEKMPDSPSLAVELIRLLAVKKKISDAASVFEEFKNHSNINNMPYVTNVMIDIYLDNRMSDKAGKLFNELPQYLSGKNSIDAAILARRMGREKAAHKYFERAGDTLFQEPRAIHEFAQTKIKLAQEARRTKNFSSNKKLLKEAKELLEYALQMDTDKVRQAWLHRDLGRVMRWLGHPITEVQNEYTKAIELIPDEIKFMDELKNLK